MNYYYCKSKWEHAVIAAQTVGRAKSVFIEIVNRALEGDKKLSIKDVDAKIVNLYLDESD